MAGGVVSIVKMLVTSSLITMQNMVALFMLCERRRSLKNWRRRQRGRPRRNRPLPTCHLAKFIIVYFYQVRQKVTPKIICCFLTNRLEFLSEILPVYVTTLSTLKRQVAFSNL